MKKILLCFAAGCLGGLVNSLVVWQGGELGIARWAGVAMAPALGARWLYPRIVWGGIWGLLFSLPVLKSRHFLKGTLLSLVPTAVQLFYIYPVETGHGLMGMRLGMWTPVLVLAYHLVWGWATALTLRMARA